LQKERSWSCDIEKQLIFIHQALEPELKQEQTDQNLEFARNLFKAKDKKAYCQDIINKGKGN
jgi:hypothetical protein